MRCKKKNAYQLYRAIKGKRVVVFGTGKIMEKRFSSFDFLHFEEHVDYLVDNNKEKWDTAREINGKTLYIRSPQYMREHVKPDTIVLIWMKNTKDIVKQLNEYEETKKLICYSYPDYYHNKYIGVIDKIIDKLRPSKRVIIFQGEGDNRENALSLFEYMQESRLIRRYKVVWFCSHPEQFTSSRNIKYINRNTLHIPASIREIWDFKYYSRIAGYIMYENMFIYKTHPDQKAFYLKHGTFMLKDVKGKIVIPEEVDYAICTSENYADLACDQESISRDRLVICGSPRLDFLYKEKNVLKTLGLYEQGKKYILWLPTLRQTKDGMRNDVRKVAPYGIPLVKSENDFYEMDDCLGKLNLKLIIKPHPHQDLSVYRVDGYKNIIFVPQSTLDENEFVIHSLMRETDALISDYSSVAFDYMLLDNPMAYTVDDWNDYKIGFSIPDPLHYMPGEKLENCDDMLRFFDNVARSVDIYQNERHEIRDYIHKYQDDKNAERFLSMMDMKKGN